MDSVYESGNTIRLGATFKDFDDILTDPSILKIIVYDNKFNKIQELIPSKISTGIYTYNYTLPQEEKRLFYEWYCEINGSIGIKRSEIRTVFIKKELT